MPLTQVADVGPGASGGGTQRIIVASNQPSLPSIAGGNTYKTVAASQTNFLLGASGAVGDYLEGLVCTVNTAATSQVSIKDGSLTAVVIFPNSPGPGIGTYYIPLGAKSTSGGWQVSTGAGVTVIATGTFT